MPSDISRDGNQNIGRRSNPSRIHRCVITRVVETALYEFTIPELDPTMRFGPSVGTPGLLVGDEPFALPTVDMEWFIVDPTIIGGGGGGIEEEVDPVAGPALAAHELETTGVHGIADTTVLATDAEVAAAVEAHRADTTVVHGIADTSALVLTSDARLSDQRVPTDNSVTSAKIVDGAIVNADINAAAAIAKSKLAALNIVNADIDAAAAIAKSKLAALAIVNADVAAGAAIAKSKLAALAIVNADVDAAAAIAESKLALASDAAAGTASRRTLGTGALQAAAGNHVHVVGAWVGVSFGTGWVNYNVANPGWAPVQYVTDITGFVNMRGLAARTSGTGTLICTIPAGLRPLYNIALLIHAFTGSAFSEGRVDLNGANGQLSLVLPGTITNTGYINLENLRWKAEQ